MRSVRILAILTAVVASSGSIVDAVTYAEPSENHINTGSGNTRRAAGLLGPTDYRGSTGEHNDLRSLELQAEWRNFGYSYDHVH